MTIFWTGLCAMIVLALLFLVPPLLRGSAARRQTTTNELNVALFEERLAELKADLGRGAIEQQQYEAACADLQRALLYDVTDEQAVGADGGKFSGRVAAGVVSVALPALALALYLELGASPLLPLLAVSSGSPPGVDPADRAARGDSPVKRQGNVGDQAPGSSQGVLPSVEELTRRLAQRLRSNPDDAEGWFMLGRSHMHLGQYGESIEAFSNALRVGGENPSVMVLLAEAMALANGSRLGDRPTALLDSVLEREPDNTRALWLRGFAHFQRQEYSQAIERWQRAAMALAPDSEEAKQVAASIREAHSRLGEGGASPTRPVTGAGTTEAPANGPTQELATGAKTITVRVELDQHLAGRVSPNDVVFIFARAEDGDGAMPVAVVRERVKNLPFTVTLDDSMSMSPAMKLSQFSRVSLNARLSRSGTAERNSGDLEGRVAGVSPGTSKTINLRIDRIVP